MLNLYEAGKDGSWRLPDLAYDGEAWAAVRLHCDSASLPAAGETLALLQANVQYLNLEGTECQLPEGWLSLPVLTAEKLSAVSENQDVVRRVVEAEAARLQELAGQAARREDWKEVQTLLNRVREMASCSAVGFRALVGERQHVPPVHLVVQRIEAKIRRFLRFVV
jgi:Ca-activated chloride channel homolog